MKWQDVLPVLLSIIVIILVAVLEKQSRLIAAITATMPLTATLALWVVYSSTGGEKESMTAFINGLIVGIIPTVIFLAAIWFGFRQGLRLVPLIGVGYLSWGVALGIILLIRRALVF
jgi:uncharacterized membrane protein (GlpM family)